jgi:hypothetical protein
MGTDWCGAVAKLVISMGKQKELVKEPVTMLRLPLYIPHKEQPGLKPGSPRHQANLYPPEVRNFIK